MTRTPTSSGSSATDLMRARLTARRLKRRPSSSAAGCARDHPWRRAAIRLPGGGRHQALRLVGDLIVDDDVEVVGRELPRRGEVAPAAAQRVQKDGDQRAENGAEPEAVEREPERADDRSEPVEDAEQPADQEADHGAAQRATERRAAVGHAAGHLLDELEVAPDDRHAFDREPPVGEAVDGALGVLVAAERGHGAAGRRRGGRRREASTHAGADRTPPKILNRPPTASWSMTSSGGE